MNVQDLLKSVAPQKTELLEKIHLCHLQFIGKKQQPGKEKFLQDFGEFFDALLDVVPVETDNIMFFCDEDNSPTIIEKQEVVRTYQSLSENQLLGQDYSEVVMDEKELYTIASIAQPLIWHQEGFQDRPVKDYLGIEVDPYSLGERDTLMAAAIVVHSCACFGDSDEDSDNIEYNSSKYCFDLTDEMEKEREFDFKLTEFLNHIAKKDRDVSQQFFDTVKKCPSVYVNMLQAVGEYGLNQLGFSCLLIPR